MLRQLAIKVFHTTGCGICITTVGLYMPTVTESLLGCCAHRLSRLQSVLHAAARLIYGARRRFDHMTPLLQQLHCLSVPERVIFNIGLYTITSE